MTGFSSLIAHRSTCLALAGAGAVHMALTAAGLPGWQCPFRAATGLPCPGCGLTRACVLLLSGHFREGISVHAFAPLALVGIALVGAGATLPHESRDELVRFIRKFDTLALVLLAAIPIYWLTRLILDGRG